MQGTVEQFLATSPVAEKTRVPTRIVVQRTRLSPEDISRIAENGTYAIDAGKELCELEIGGQVIGLGRIVRKGGRRYLKLIKAAPMGGRRG